MWIPIELGLRIARSLVVPSSTPTERSGDRLRAPTTQEDAPKAAARRSAGRGLDSENVGPRLPVAVPPPARDFDGPSRALRLAVNSGIIRSERECSSRREGSTIDDI